MGGKSFGAAALLLILLNVAHGGKTSPFIRKVRRTEDMPLHSDVFAAPSGYNAPQQVPLFLLISSSFTILTHNFLASTFS